jgi:hypothetical protein
MNKSRLLAIVLFFFGISAAHAAIEFSGVFNFRDYRVNPPLTYNPGPDLLILGIRVTDSNTGQAPEGAIVRARNQLSGEEIVLRKNGTEYFELLSYTTERAAGDWIVEVNSFVGSASALIPAFGTGSGTGPMPTVENLVTSETGAQPAFSWTLPPDLANQNDGNIDRLRARIRDSSDAIIVDDRFDPTASATDYITPLGPITHNGAYVAQIMVEGFTPFSRSRNLTTFVVDDVGVGGEPVTLGAVYHARDFRGANSIGWSSGDRQDVCVNVEPFGNTYVYAEQPVVLPNYPQGVVVQTYPQRDNPGEFCSGMAYNPALTGPWNMVAWNGEQTASVQTYALGVLDKLPLITNIRIVPDNLTPTIRWDLPAGNTVPYDVIAVGLFDDTTDFRLFRLGPNQDSLFDFLGASETSYTFPEGVLEEGGRYVARVMLIDLDNDGNNVNRAVTFFNFTPIMESGGGEVFLPTLDQGGIYNFDFDVTEAVPVTIDPEVAVGYVYEIGPDDARFATVQLPFVGDGLYDLTVFNDLGDAIHAFEVAALALVDLTEFDPSGVRKFEVRGIETSAGLDPLDTTAFMTTLTFASSGRFTGSMTPIVENVDFPEDVLAEVSAAIQQLIDAGVPEKAAKKLRKAREKLIKAQSQLAKGDIKKAVKELSKTIKELGKAEKEGVPTVSLIDSLLDYALAAAEASIDEAIANAGDPKDIEKALKELDKGQKDLGKGKPDKAVKHYGHAIDKAGKATR